MGVGNILHFCLLWFGGNHLTAKIYFVCSLSNVKQGKTWAINKSNTLPANNSEPDKGVLVWTIVLLKEPVPCHVERFRLCYLVGGYTWSLLLTLKNGWSLPKILGSHF